MITTRTWQICCPVGEKIFEKISLVYERDLMLCTQCGHHRPDKAPDYYGAFVAITPCDHNHTYRYSTIVPHAGIKPRCTSIAGILQQSSLQSASWGTPRTGIKKCPSVTKHLDLGATPMDGVDDAIRRAYEEEETRPRLRDLPDGYRVSLIVSVRLGDLRAHKSQRSQRTNEAALMQRDLDHVADWLCRRDVTPGEKIIALKQIPSVRDALQRRKGHKHPSR